MNSQKQKPKQNNRFLEEREQASFVLEKYENQKISFARKVFFVPGWASEKFNLWENSFSAQNISMSQWAQKIVQNHQETFYYLQFSQHDSEECRTFESFGKLLYSKIKPFLKDKDEVFDIVGYSMGGLDVCSGVIFDNIPLGCVGKVITLGCPFCGEKYAILLRNLKIIAWVLFGSWWLVRYMIYKIRGYTEANLLQLESLNPGSRYIKEMGTQKHRLKFLAAVEKLYVFYGENDRFVGKNTAFDKRGIDEKILKEKLEEFSFEGAKHYGALGLIQDPRVILKLIEILSGRDLQNEKTPRRFHQPYGMGDRGPCD